VATAKVFISYTWEEEPHPTWVKGLATRLRTKDGLDVSLDRWDAQPGDELTAFMEKGIRGSRFVLLICTPTYKARFDERIGGVGYEAKAITGEIVVGLAKQKIIPVHRKGTWKDAAPSIVLGSFYIDLAAEPYGESQYRTLVDTLHGRREVAPPIGFSDTLFEGPGGQPARPVADFTGRDDEMDALIEKLGGSDEDAVCVVASGIGGVGKTSLARQFVATRAGSLFAEGAAWLDGVNLVAELARVCRRLGWPEANDPTPETAIAFLARNLHDRAFLLVIDNLTETGDRRLVPIPGGRCRTLITSRATDVAQDLDAPAVTIRLAHWPPAISRAYLRDVVPRLAGEPDADLDALATFVQGLPLAIRLIGRALGQNVARTVREHLERLRKEPVGALDAAVGPADRGVAATFLESYRALAPLEQAALRALASSAQGTRAEIVAAVAGNAVAATEDALNTLYRFSLVDHRQGALAPWGLHDVVRLFTRAQPEIAESDTAHLAWVKAHLAAHANPLDHEKLDEGISEALVTFDRFLVRGHVAAASQLLDLTYLHLTHRGRSAQVAKLIEQLLAALPVEADDGRAAWLGNLGLCHRTLGDFPKAIDILQRSLTIYENLGNLAGQANVLGNLGVCYKNLGEIPKAIDFHRRALALHEKLDLLGSQATDLGNLGACSQVLGDIPGAIDYLQRALAIDEKLGNLEGQANHLGNLGGCYENPGDIPGAIDYLQRALTIDESLGKLEGQAIQLNNLGHCYRLLGEIPKAINFLERSLATFRAMGFPESHPRIRFVLRWLEDLR
jgi:tetratricopeptide (TPR) repeat protein